MKQALYAGSFDPWTFGHQFVLDSVLEVFDCVHIVSAINPAKNSIIKSEVRARLIAHAIDPFCDWWSLDPPFLISDRVVVTSHEGLVAYYAEIHGIKHFIRGLRSTTDFESEFNLYFANLAINEHLQTWTIMCPPNLLHCSSTYVKTVVGKAHVKFVGTNFCAQALMLGWVRVIGQIFDLIVACSEHRFNKMDSSNLTSRDLSESVQLLFSNLHQRIIRVPRSAISETVAKFNLFIKEKSNILRELVKDKKEYPEAEVLFLWSLLANCVDQDEILNSNPFKNGAAFLLSLTKNLGKTSIKLFDEEKL